MADAADSKSAGGDIVRVQVPPSALANDFNFDTMHPLWKLWGALWVRGCKANSAVHIANYTIFYNDSLIISYALIDEILTSIKFCGLIIEIEHKSYDKK